MADSPVPISCQNEAEMIKESPDLCTSTPIDEGSISEKSNLPILFKPAERTCSMSSHIDENNENEAVRTSADCNAYDLVILFELYRCH